MDRKQELSQEEIERLVAAWRSFAREHAPILSAVQSEMGVSREAAALIFAAKVFENGVWRYAVGPRNLVFETRLPGFWRRLVGFWRGRQEVVIVNPETK